MQKAMFGVYQNLTYLIIQDRFDEITQVSSQLIKVLNLNSTLSMQHH